MLALMGDTIDNIKGVPGIGEKGARELICQLRIAREPARPRLGDHAEALSRTAARQHGVGAAEPRARAHPDRRARRLRSRRPPLPRRVARALLSRSSTSSAFRTLVAEYAPTAATHVQDLSDRVDRRGARGAGRAARGERTLRAARRSPAGGSAMTASIVGLAFSTAPRDADYVPIGHRGARTGGLSLPLETALDALRPVLENPAITKVGHDLKFDAILLARHGVELRGLDIDTMIASYLHDATQVAAPARGSRARAHQLQGAHRGRRLRPRRQGACRWRTFRSRPRSTTPASAPTSPASWRRCSATCSKQEQLDEVYTSLELPLIPVLVAVERAGVRIDRPALAGAVAAGRSGARPANRRDLPSWPAASSTSIRRSSCRKSCSTSCSCRS